MYRLSRTKVFFTKWLLSVAIFSFLFSMTTVVAAKTRTHQHLDTPYTKSIKRKLQSFRKLDRRATQRLIRHLSAQGSKAAPIVAQALTSKHPKIRVAAERILLRMRSRSYSALPILKSMLQTNKLRQKLIVLMILRNMSTKARGALPEVARLINDKHPTVRRKAVKFVLLHTRGGKLSLKQRKLRKQAQEQLGPKHRYGILGAMRELQKTNRTFGFHKVKIRPLTPTKKMRTKYLGAYIPRDTGLGGGGSGHIHLSLSKKRSGPQRKKPQRRSKPMLSKIQIATIRGKTDHGMYWFIAPPLQNKLQSCISRSKGKGRIELKSQSYFRALHIKFIANSIKTRAARNCLLHTLKSWSFPKTKSKNIRPTTISLFFMPPYKRKVSKVQLGAFKIPSFISAKRLKRRANYERSYFRICYENSRLRDPVLEGDIVFSWAVQSWGRAGYVRVIRSSLRNRTVERCIIKRIKRWRFSKPPGQSKAKVQFTIRFQTIYQ